MNNDEQMQPPATQQTIPVVLPLRPAQPEIIPVPDEMDQFVSPARLLQLLFPKDGRPSERWLRRMVVKGRIPAIRVGGRVWYHPNKVREALLDYKKPAGRPKGSKNRPKPANFSIGDAVQTLH